MLTIAMLLGLRRKPVPERTLDRERERKRVQIRRLLAEIADAPER